MRSPFHCLGSRFPPPDSRHLDRWKSRMLGPDKECNNTGFYIVMRLPAASWALAQMLLHSLPGPKCKRQLC
eukprot:14659735-Alexandrium_andersonii.AAC.1